MNGLLPDHGSEQRRARNALRLLQALVERRRERAGATADLAGDSKDGIEGPWRALHEAVVGIVGGVEYWDEDVTPREEAAERECSATGSDMKALERSHMEQFASFAIRDEAL